MGTGNTMTATTCSEFTEYNTKLSVYCSSCGDPACVGGNDDDCDLFGGLHSTVTWCSQAGAEYLILVHGSGAATGGFDLSVFDDGVACAGPVDCLPPDPCPWDLDGGGFVGAGDLLLLLAAWGNPYGAIDLLALLAAWGTCPGAVDACENPQVCGKYTFDCNPDNPDCACVELFDGSGLCVADWDCTGVECPDGTCPSGFVCVVSSCCGDTTCAPIEFVCSENLGPPVFEPGTQTGLGDAPE